MTTIVQVTMATVAEVDMAALAMETTGDSKPSGTRRVGIVVAKVRAATGTIGTMIGRRGKEEVRRRVQTTVRVVITRVAIRRVEVATTRAETTIKVGMTKVVIRR